MDPAAQVTRLLLDLKNGDPAAVDRLIPIVYDELSPPGRALLARRALGRHPSTHRARARGVI